jgi:hypothetical protein
LPLEIWLPVVCVFVVLGVHWDDGLTFIHIIILDLIIPIRHKSDIKLVMARRIAVLDVVDDTKNVLDLFLGFRGERILLHDAKNCITADGRALTGTHR